MAEKLFARNPFAFNIRGNLIAGVLALAPLIAVWLVFKFLLEVLFEAGEPLAKPLADQIEAWNPRLAPLLANPTAHWLTAVLVALAVIYAIGFVTSRVIGKRLIHYVEQVILRIPLVETIYSAVKKLVGVIQHAPQGTARVVLVEFPHPGTRAIALVMRVFKDMKTGDDLAAVLVPSAPNPTTGFLLVVPAKELTPTDLSMDQAMTIIVSGGATAPDHISFKPG
ncbi:MAG TPA: DUF502 domain-containing protein [Rhizomicrobium sp.]|nr:DUF502 domain-containing protein [Rhizomicrobium sp.]